MTGQLHYFESGRRAQQVQAQRRQRAHSSALGFACTAFSHCLFSNSAGRTSLDLHMKVQGHKCVSSCACASVRLL